MKTCCLSFPEKILKPPIDANCAQTPRFPLLLASSHWIDLTFNDMLEAKCQDVLKKNHKAVQILTNYP